MPGSQDRIPREPYVREGYFAKPICLALISYYDKPRFKFGSYLAAQHFHFDVLITI